MGFGYGQGRNKVCQKAMQKRKQALFGDMDADKNCSQAETIADGKAWI
jgi:hypothetical protein